MNDRPRCSGCGHPLDQENTPETDVWSPCDAGCRHSGRTRPHLLGGGTWARDRWPVEVKCSRCGGLGLTGVRDEWGFGQPCPRCYGEGTFTVCHTCAEEDR